MRAIGINTWVWTSPVTDASLPDLLETIAAMGFDGVELPLENAGDLDPDVTAAALKEADLSAWVVGAMAPGRDLVAVTPDAVADTQDYLRACVDLAVAVGAPAVCGPFYAQTGRVWRMTGDERAAAYAELLSMQTLLLEGSRDAIAAMATTSALLHHAFGHLWTGFYRVVEPGDRLVVGPYQGSLGCLDITFGRGVCGTAAAERRTVVVADVHEFPGHIACDAASNSEIVVPLLSGAELLGVLDLDSPAMARFDEQDQAGLEMLVKILLPD